MVRGRKITGAQVVGGVLVLGLALLVLKWLLITALVLVVPFGVWWLHDRSRTPAPAGVAPVPATPVRHSGPPVPRRPPVPPRSPVALRSVPADPVTTPIAVVRVPTSGPAVLPAERDVVVTREEDHQDVLAQHHRAGAAPTRVTADLHPSTVTGGRHRGSFAIEVRLDGVRVGELTATMSERYRSHLGPSGHARAEGRVSHGDRGFQLDLRLPAVD